jgi:hypothetical protein
MIDSKFWTKRLTVIPNERQAARRRSGKEATLFQYVCPENWAFLEGARSV